MNDRLKHDFRNWLTALRGALDVGDFSLARGVADQMAGLLGAPRVTAVSLNAAVALLRGPDVRIEPAVPDVFVRADAAAIGRVLLNLTVNANQAGGDVTLRVGRDGWVAVEDHGPGIPAEMMMRVFEPGFTTLAKADGCGLGLAIVREVVEASGGSVTMDSVVGGGTTVTVRWPLAETEQTSPLAPPAWKDTAMTVLLIEDEPIVRQLAERMLNRAGCRVVAVGSAEAALAATETLTPDVVVADLTLPGMDGRTVIAALRGRWPKLPAVLVSGYADSARSADLAGEKMVFLAKPYALEDLVAAVRG